MKTISLDESDLRKIIAEKFGVYELSVEISIHSSPYSADSVSVYVESEDFLNELLSKYEEIMKYDANARPDKCEDTSKMFDQTLRKLKENFTKIEKETARIMMYKEKINKKVLELENSIRDSIKSSKFVNGETVVDEDYTKDFDQYLIDRLAEVKKTQADIKDKADKMNQIYTKLSHDIQLLETKVKDYINGKGNVEKC